MYSAQNYLDLACMRVGAPSITMTVSQAAEQSTVHKTIFSFLLWMRGLLEVRLPAHAKKCSHQQGDYLGRPEYCCLLASASCRSNGAVCRFQFSKRMWFSMTTG